MQIRNLVWARDKLSWLLHYNEGQNDQDFVGPSTHLTKRLDDLLQQAYEMEMADAKIVLPQSWFTTYEDFSWPANQVTLTLPSSLVSKEFTKWEDVTNGVIGADIEFLREKIIWLNSSTLQWSDTGPPSTLTIRAWYLAAVEELTEDSQEPVYIPHANRWMWVWRAAIIGRRVADQEAPKEWVAQHAEMQKQYHTVLASGRLSKGDPAVMKPSQKLMQL